MGKTKVAERIRVIRDTDQTFPVGPDDLELKLNIYDPDWKDHSTIDYPVLVDADSQNFKALTDLADIGKSMAKAWKYVPSSRLLITSLVKAYELMQKGDERAGRFLGKFMNRELVSERVATDGGFYGIVHYDGLGTGIYKTECPTDAEDLDQLWKGEVARTLQILTGLKEPDKLMELAKHYNQEKPVVMPPERTLRAVHIGYTTPLSICFGYYPDGHSADERGVIARGMSIDSIITTEDKNRE